MIVRIVRMTFRPDAVADFIVNFEANKRKIRAFEGCRKLELLRDVDRGDVFFTYSYWKSAEHLEAYRNSEFFKEVWQKTKTFFADAPEAWSMERIIEMP